MVEAQLALQLITAAMVITVLAFDAIRTQFNKGTKSIATQHNSGTPDFILAEYLFGLHNSRFFDMQCK